MRNCCVVIPCYNEADRLQSDEFIAFVRANQAYTLLFVDDGSTDGTGGMLSRIARDVPAIRVLSLKANGGKAEAVRSGVLQALTTHEFSHIAFLDADLAIPVEEFLRLVRTMSGNPACEFAHLSKMRSENVRQSALRYLMGRILATLAQLSLRIPVHDTQCGCKLLSSELAQIAFQEKFISPWLFDIEIFHRIMREKGREYLLAHWTEVPLKKLVDRGSSRVKGIDILHLPFELWKIHRTYRTS